MNVSQRLKDPSMKPPRKVDGLRRAIAEPHTNAIVTSVFGAYHGNELLGHKHYSNGGM
jgi:hypothetical protein